MGIEAEISRNILADPDVIWEQLTDTKTWPAWWIDCQSAKTMDEKRLDEGSRLELVVKPGTVALTLRPEVDLMSPLKTLSMTHHTAFIHTTCSWQLVERPEGVRVTGQVVFNGLFAFLISILQRRSTVRLCLNNFMKGLKRSAERKGLD